MIRATLLTCLLTCSLVWAQEPPSGMQAKWTDLVQRLADPGRRDQARRLPFALAKLVLDDRAVGPLADAVHVESEEKVAHRGVPGDNELVDCLRIAVEILDGVGQVAEQGPLQDPPRMVAIVLDPRHDVAAAA